MGVLTEAGSIIRTLTVTSNKIITFMTLSNLPHNPISTSINIDKLIARSFVVVINTA